VKESHQEFVARMDRARAEDERQTNIASLIVIPVYLGFAYFLFSGAFSRIPWMMVWLFAADSLVLFVVIRSLVSVYRSRKL